VALIKDETKNSAKLKYTDIVKLTQDQLHKISDKRRLILKVNQKEITYGDNTIKFEPLEFAIYYKLQNKNLKALIKYRFILLYRNPLRTQ